MPTITDQLAEEVMARCDELAACSEEEGRVTRRFLTPPMQNVHQRLSAWMKAAGLQPRVDNAGNLIGRLGGAESNRVLLLGSHLDSVPNAGRYDGVLGVLIGVAVAQSLESEGLPFHFDVMGFSEEEGERFSMPYLGSSAVAGLFDPQWLCRCDRDGHTMGDAICKFGLDAGKIADAAYSPDEVIAYVEPHLEQGPMLENAKLPIGVVTGIAGQSRLRLEFTGTAGHAGTTPMLNRSDALVMTSEFVGEVNSIGRQTKGLRATVGRLSVKPNAPNVIPARVELSLDVRHVDDLIRERAINDMLAAGKRIAKSARGGFSVLETNGNGAAEMDQATTETLTSAIAECGHHTFKLFSGAGHDAVVMSKRFPTAMLFLRHPGGISHHPDERAERKDVAVAIEVLTQFVRKLALQFKHEPAGSS